MGDRVDKLFQQLTRSKAAARMDASGIVPGSQQFNRNWKRFMPCRIAPRFTTFLLFPPSWLEDRWSSKLWQPVGFFPWWKNEKTEYNRSQIEKELQSYNMFSVVLAWKRSPWLHILLFHRNAWLRHTMTFGNLVTNGISKCRILHKYLNTGSDNFTYGLLFNTDKSS